MGGGLKKPLLALNRLLGHASAKNHMSKPRIGDVANLDVEKERKRLLKVEEQLAKEDERERERQAQRQRRKEEEELALSSDAEDVRARYGSKLGIDLIKASAALQKLAMLPHDVGLAVSFTARLHHVRSMSAKLAFVVFRQQTETMQGVLALREGVTSMNFVRWAGHLVTESFVHVTGVLQAPKEPITGCTIHDVELLIDSMHVIAAVEDHLPLDVFTIDRVERNEEDKVESLASNRTRAANRIAFLRTPTAQSIFRIKSGICSIFRSELERLDFIEIHTPKLQPAATESGAQVFKTNYFGRTAFLAQSPQLAKQMCISADFGRVFEIGPVFRAEDSNTHRHLTEYMGMDLEMAFVRDYHEVMRIIDDLLKKTFECVYSRYRKEVDMVKTHFPHEDLIWLEKTPIIPFREGIDLLNSSGWKDEHGNKADPFADLSTRAEIRLGELVRDVYKTDYFILDKFPASVRPFYTHPDSEDERYTNSFDIFLRGQEITTGGQRINDHHDLLASMKKAGIEPSTMSEYLQAFEYGVLPHAGCGIGLERLLFLLLNLGDIRNASLYPRDPKSFAETVDSTPTLPHPEADTIRFAHNYAQGNQDEPLPTVENLISNYGDATNTSWLDHRYKVWRHRPTGAAVGYASENGYALVMGNPLCDRRQYALVIRAFLEDMRMDKDLRPIWLLVSQEVEAILSERLAWRSLSCVAEERIQVDNAKKVTRKERQAQEAGIRITSTALGEDVAEATRQRIDKRIEDWKASRKGTQVHITEVRPWIDMAHRRYLWAETKEGDIAALVILHRLSPANGFQIKFALDFPGAPSGTIEALISESIAVLAKAGVKNVTFGAGAQPELLVGEHLSGIRAKLLSHSYRTIAHQLKLVQKSEFREKFGTVDDPVYICYPFLGLGVSGARTVVKFFEDEM